MHPDIYFDRFLPGSITVSFDVKVDDLTPSELGPYGENPWLNVVTLFDETTRAGGTTFHPSVMVNLVGTPGQYRLQAYSISPAGAGTFFDKLKDGSRISHRQVGDCARGGGRQNKTSPCLPGQRACIRRAISGQAGFGRGAHGPLRKPQDDAGNSVQ